MPTPAYSVNQTVGDFVVQLAQYEPSLRTLVYAFVHPASGARILHLANDDAENLFSVAFPTPPSDDTGVPHILEHAVLSGSRRFPVRDPFFEMIKMSMATFINAMTGWDTTYYPVCSNVKKDLLNLAQVYFDAVFHPLLTEETFQREGHHLLPLDPANPTGPLAVSGIVFNEMKGYFSNPETRLYRLMSRSLLPDSIYGKESGGDPEAIPDLTYAQLCAFHRTYYHPSNGLFVLYGNIPTAEYLDFLAPRLQGFARTDDHRPIARQPRWTAPRRVEAGYPVSEQDELAGKTYLALSWVAGDATDPLEGVLFHILSLILLGHEGAPLKKALIDSQLGKDLVYAGDSDAGIEMLYMVGLKGSEPERAAAFEKLVLDQLAALAGQTFDRAAVDAAFQQGSYHFLEVSGHHPLNMMYRALAGWRYGKEPTSFLPMSDHLAELRRRYEREPDLFNKLIQQRLVDNPHRLAIMLRPDRGWQQRWDEAFTQRMTEVRRTKSDDECRAIAAQAEELDRRSGQPNSSDALATLPQLAISDLPAKPRHIPTQVEALGAGATLLRNEVFANGVNYLHLDFVLRDLPAELWPYVPRYTEALAKFGVGNESYTVTAQRVAACTAGIVATPLLSSDVTDPTRPVWSLRVTTKFLDAQAGAALEVLRDVLTRINPQDHARLRDVLTQARAWYESSLVNNGAQTASHHAGRGLSAAGYLSHQILGLPQMALAKEYTDQFDRHAGQVTSAIMAVRDFVLAPARLTASFTGSDAVYPMVRNFLRDWSAAMPAASIGPVRAVYTPYAQPPCEGLAGPMQIAYCCVQMPAPHFAHPDEPFLSVGCRMVNLDYVLTQVRFKGNAYGAWLRHDGLSATLEFGSYRDPRIVETLDIYRDAGKFVEQADWKQIDVDRNIIGSAKGDERPIRPADATSTALTRHLIGLTPALREARFDKLKSATPAQVKQAVRSALEQGWPHAATCVVSSREKLTDANQRLPGREMTITDIR